VIDDLRHWEHAGIFWNFVRPQVDAVMRLLEGHEPQTRYGRDLHALLISIRACGYLREMGTVSKSVRERFEVDDCNGDILVDEQTHFPVEGTHRSAILKCLNLPVPAQEVKRRPWPKLIL
jgi:hypothetical protein